MHSINVDNLYQLLSAGVCLNWTGKRSIADLTKIWEIVQLQKCFLRVVRCETQERFLSPLIYTMPIHRSSTTGQSWRPDGETGPWLSPSKCLWMQQHHISTAAELYYIYSRYNHPPHHHHIFSSHIADMKSFKLTCLTYVWAVRRLCALCVELVRFSPRC